MAIVFFCIWGCVLTVSLGDLGTRLPDIIGAAAGCFVVAVLPRALRDGARAIGEQLVPQVAGETSRAV